MSDKYPVPTPNQLATSASASSHPLKVTVNQLDPAREENLADVLSDIQRSIDDLLNDSWKIAAVVAGEFPEASATEKVPNVNGLLEMTKYVRARLNHVHGNHGRTLIALGGYQQ